MNDDAQLLRRFAENQDQTSFAELVNRHLPLVHAAAMRQVGGDAHLAADVAQTVFTDLARKAAALVTHPLLVGWLHTSTHHAAAKIVRTEQRRRTREIAATAMNETSFAPDSEENLDWTHLGPVLDGALQRLKEQDRTVLLLRYFEHRSYNEIGQRTGLSENAARMKADRALGKLRDLLSKRGISSTAAALALSLTGHAVVPPPAGLAALITQQALAQAAGAAGAAAGITGLFATMKSLGLPIALGGTLVSAFVIGYGNQRDTENALRAEIASYASAPQTGSQTFVAASPSAAIAPQTPPLSEGGAGALSAKGSMTSAERTPVATTEADGSDVYDLKKLTRPPKPVSRMRPEYPAELRATGIRGEITMSFIVDRDGSVRDVKTVSASHPGFEKAATEALEKWKFEPGQKDGKAVKTRLQIPIIFEIAGKNKSWF